jgi:argininosuccinate lyase
MFVMAPRPGRVVAVDGLDRLTADPQVHHWALPVPVEAARPVDNEAYLGHGVVLGPGVAGARAHAERLVGSLRLRFADGSTAPPLGVAGV